MPEKAGSSAAATTPLLTGSKLWTATAVALCLCVAWYGEVLRLYEHPYFGFINPGPGIGGSLLLMIGVWRKWRWFRGFAMFRLGLGVFCYAIVSIQSAALRPQALLLGVGTAIILYVLVRMLPGEQPTIRQSQPAQLGFG